MATSSAQFSPVKSSLTPSSGSTSEPYDRHALRLLFNACDPHHAGAITKANLLDGCRRLQLDDLTESDADALFAELDVDGGGRVSFDAFADRFTVWSRQTMLQRDVSGEVEAEADRPAPAPAAETRERKHGASHQETERVRLLQDYYNADPSCSLLEKLLVEEWRWDAAHVSGLLQSLSPQHRHGERELSSLFLQAIREEKRLPDPAEAEAQHLGARFESVSVHERRVLDTLPEEGRRRSVGDVRRGSFPLHEAGSGPLGRRNTVDSLNSGTESELDTNLPTALKGHDDLRLLWEKLRISRPELLDPFSSFLDTVSQQLEDAELQRDRMQVDLQKETRSLDRRAQELDEEAVLQIETEKHKLKKLEEDRLQRLRDQMLGEIEQREKKLDLALRHVHGLQSKVDQLSQKEKQMESKCEELQQVKSTLETELHIQKIRQLELKAQMESSGHESPARPLSRQSESDSEVLQKQLESLRLMNTDLKRELQDRVDELVATEQSKRHGKVADLRQTQSQTWYDSEEDWTSPFKGNAMQKSNKRIVRGPRSLYTSDDDTDDSPMPDSIGKRHWPRGAEMQRHVVARSQRRQLQSPVPLAMDRFLRRKSAANESDCDSDEKKGHVNRQLDHSLVREASEKDRDGVATSDGQQSSSGTAGSQTPRSRGATKDLTNGQSQVSLDPYELSPEKQTRDSGIEATPAHSAHAISMATSVSPTSPRLRQPGAPLSEPEGAAQRRFGAHAGVDAERSLMSDSGFVRSHAVAHPRTGAYHPQQQSYVQYPVPGPGSHHHRGGPAYPADAETWMSHGHPGAGHHGMLPAFQHNPRSTTHSPRVGRRLSPASSGSGTPLTRELADDRLSVHSFDATMIAEEDAAAADDPGPSGTEMPVRREFDFATPSLYDRYVLDQTNFKRTHSLQSHSGNVRRGNKKKRKKFEEHSVRALAPPAYKPGESPRPLASSQDPSHGHSVMAAASVPTESFLKASDADLEPADLDSAPGALVRGGPVRGSTGNLSLMEMTAEEHDAPGRPEAMPVVVHPIKASTPQYQTRHRPISPTIARRVGIMPERVFKVVLCGESNVGKTSYIWRLCNTSAEYSGEFKSTLGVDYKMKVLEVDGHITVLQLWDTAGQERFRTFTRQYFRKADGVICCYDITNHNSFVRLQQWLADVEEATGGGVAVMVIGNKHDTADLGPRPKRQVTYWQGQQQAQRAGAMFAEVSAKTGHGVLETCMELAKVLYSAEKEELTDLLTLTSAAPQKKKERSCC